MHSDYTVFIKRKWRQTPTVPICSDGSGVVGGRLGFLAAVPYFILAIYHGLSRYICTYDFGVSDLIAIPNTSV